ACRPDHGRGGLLGVPRTRARCVLLDRRRRRGGFPPPPPALHSRRVRLPPGHRRIRAHGPRLPVTLKPPCPFRTRPCRPCPIGTDTSALPRPWVGEGSEPPATRVEPTAKERTRA